MTKSLLARKVYFSCARRLFLPELTREENLKIFGNQYSPKGTGHNFSLEAFVAGSIEPDSGMIMNIQDLDELLKSVTADLDNTFLNEEISDFKDKLPTTENMAQMLYLRLASKLPSSTSLKKIILKESENSWVEVEQ